MDDKEHVVNEYLSILFTRNGHRREGGATSSMPCFVRQILRFDIQNLSIQENKVA